MSVRRERATVLALGHVDYRFQSVLWKGCHTYRKNCRYNNQTIAYKDALVHRHTYYGTHALDMCRPGLHLTRGKQPPETGGRLRGHSEDMSHTWLL